MPSKRAKKIPAHQWNELRKEAEELWKRYKKSFKYIAKHFADTKGFPGNWRQWRKKLTMDWKKQKYLRPAERDFIVQQARQRRNHGKATEAVVYGYLHGAPKISKLLREASKGEAAEDGAPPHPHTAGTEQDFSYIQIRTPKLKSRSLPVTSVGDEISEADDGPDVVVSEETEEPAKARILAGIAVHIVHLVWYHRFARPPTSLSDAKSYIRNELYPQVPPEDGHTTAWLAGVLQNTKLSHDIVILALLYIFRLKCLTYMVAGNPSQAKGILTVALALANKNVEDKAYTTATWADLSGISANNILEAEVEFLRNVKLFLSQTEWINWYREVSKFAHAEFRKNPEVRKNLRNKNQCQFGRGVDLTVCTGEEPTSPPCRDPRSLSEEMSQLMTEAPNLTWIDNLSPEQQGRGPSLDNEVCSPGASVAVEYAHTPFSDGSFGPSTTQALPPELGVSTGLESLRGDLSPVQPIGIEGSGERFARNLAWQDIANEDGAWQLGPIPMEGPQFRIYPSPS